MSYLGANPMRVVWTICDWATLATTKKGFDVRTEFAVGGKYRHHKNGQRYRIPTIRAAKGPGSVETSIEAMTQALLEEDSEGNRIWRCSPEVLILPRQIAKYSRHQVNSVHEKSVVVKRNDHELDALKYMIVQGVRYINPARLVKAKQSDYVAMTVTGMPLQQ